VTTNIHGNWYQMRWFLLEGKPHISKAGRISEKYYFGRIFPLIVPYVAT